jgi:tRNA(fMet)-specific endonuclease VapC
MTHLLDTDHLSLLQHDTSPERAAVVLRINLAGEKFVVASVVSYHEQMRGAHAIVNASKNRSQVVKGYALMSRVISDYRQFKILPFDDIAASVHANLDNLKLRMSTMDLRISAITLANNLTLVTRNTSEFARVPNLKLEDWTK